MSESGTRWFEQRKQFKAVPKGQPDSSGPDLWTQCPSCGDALFNEVLDGHAKVCHLCGHHFRLDAFERLAGLCDPLPEGQDWQLHDNHLVPVDALQFVDSKPYSVRIDQSRRTSGRTEAFLSVSGTIEGVEVEVGIFDFQYMGGSMGSVVGERITRLYERALAKGRPALVVSASGGARMQEGVLSLMQMAKTCAALARLQDAGLPYISVLTHPTTGGVAASFAMLGDVILAEPAALIGFAGPRVIRETIGQELPEGFQTSEYLLEHGMIDRIVPRSELRPMIGGLLRQFMGMEAAEQRRAGRVEGGAREAAARGPIFSKPAESRSAK